MIRRIWSYKNAFSHAKCVYYKKLSFHQIQTQWNYYCSSSTISSNSNPHSFTVSYLVNTCGLTRESAVSAAKIVRIDNSVQADVVVDFFKIQGFSESDISAMIKSYPCVLSYPFPVNKILPTIEFLYSLGLSKDALVKSLSGYYSLLGRSFEKQIFPCFENLKNLFGSENEVVNIIRRGPSVLAINFESLLGPNIEFLRQNGVPDSSIVSLARRQFQALGSKPDEFKAIVEEVKEMGLDPSKQSFVRAISVKRSLTKSSWEKKLDAYKKWGLSKEEILCAFRKFPSFMLCSSDKIDGAMDVFVNKLGWRASYIIKSPELIGLSLKKRILPRYSVIQMLSKGCVHSCGHPATFKYTEKLFLQRYITPYKQELPHLLTSYERFKGS